MRFALFTIIVLLTSNLLGQEKRQIKAYKLQDSEKIKVDGLLDDEVWLNAKSSGDFIQYMPNPGIAPSQSTEVKFAYDNEYIYVYARMFDSAPDSILKQISGRDRLDNTDEFGFWISTYNDGNNAFNFSTNPEGVQVDRIITQGLSDRSWNAAWRVETSIDDLGWTAEFQIPLGQIRFTKIEKDAEQIWGINFWRGIRRHREKEYWHPVDPARDGFEINDSGELLGLTDITPPPRLTLYPYVSAYTISSEDETVYDFFGGVDLKAGLGEAFTMDMTLIPDFGQVVADNLVLNLSPYEVRLADNRPFFTEGTEIFNKTGLLYSRRVGEEGRLINATKVSGRTDKGLGVGVFQAITLTDSNDVTSYSIAALDQNLPNNSYVHGISTLVMREGESDDALVQAIMFGIKDKKNTYQLDGFGGYNKIYSNNENLEDNGYTYLLSLSKITGKFTFTASHSVESEHYNPNDIGYLQAPNEVTDLIEISYRNIEPTKRFIRLSGSGFIMSSKLHSPRESSFVIANLSVKALTKKFQFGMLSIESQFANGRDYFEPRIDGMYWITPKWIGPTLTISTDYRKRFAIDIMATRGFVEDPEKEWKVMFGSISPRFRVNDRLNFIYNFNFDNKYNEKGFTYLDTESTEEDISLFAKRDYLTTTNLLTGTYALSNKASIDARVRHYWSTVDIKSFYHLNWDGNLTPSDIWFVDENGLTEHERNYNAWSVDLGLRWFFSPGSELSVVWKNTLYSEGDLLPQNYFDNWETMLEESFTNSLSFKALFFVDYNTLSR